MLANGRDVAAQAPELHAALHTLVLRGSARDGRLREASVTYLRIQLQLGTLQPGSQHLQVGAPAAADSCCYVAPAGAQHLLLALPRSGLRNCLWGL